MIVLRLLRAAIRAICRSEQAQTTALQPPRQTMASAKPNTVRTAFCGRSHRLQDGLPLPHQCRVLPAEALRAELEGDLESARRILAVHAAGGPLPISAGVWKVRRE